MARGVSFDREGYEVFPKVLDAKQVADIRRAVERELGDEWHLEETFHKCPEIAALLAHKPFIEPLRKLFGDDFVFLPEFTALGDYYGPWHRDTVFAEGRGYRYRHEPDFRQGTVVFYLQDNDPLYAGGLDVLPKNGDEPVTLRTKAGDMIVIDASLEHRATPAEESSPDHLKRGIYFAVSANNAHAASYREFLGSIRTYLDDDYSYPEDVQRMADEQGLTLMT